MSIMALNLNAQLTISLPSLTADPGTTIYVPVKLTGASSSGIPIGGANIQFTYDPAVLTYVGLVNFYAATPQNQWFFSGATGTVAANWIEPSLGTLAIPDNTTLYEVQFVYNTGSCPLNYTVYEFTDAAYNLVPTTPVNGLVEPTAQPKNVTFNVDMTRQTVSPDGVHLSGSFNGWNPSQTPMVASSNGIYSVTLPLMESDTHTYRFVNGNSVSGLEIVPSDCGVPNGTGFYDRSLMIPSNDTILDTVCFSMCSKCPIDIEVTFRVDMSDQNVSASGVHLAGTFNNWSTSATPMTPGLNDVYSATLIMQPGQFHLYRFVNGDAVSGFETVPSACGSPSTMGGYDRYISPLSDTVIKLVCFSSCDTCLPQALEVLVTFSVDMSETIVSTDGVHLAGSFQGWDPSTDEMLLTNNGIYSVTVPAPVNTILEYRFINGNTWSSAEIVPAECSSNGSRTVTVESDSVLITPCYSKCTICWVGTEEAIESNSLGLSQNYPNPADLETHIQYSLPSSGSVMLMVNNALGQIIYKTNETWHIAGKYQEEINTSKWVPGLYQYRLLYRFGSDYQTLSRMMIVK